MSSACYTQFLINYTHNHRSIITCPVVYALLPSEPLCTTTLTNKESLVQQQGPDPSPAPQQLCWNAEPSWRYSYLGMNPSLCGLRLPPIPPPPSPVPPQRPCTREKLNLSERLLKGLGALGAAKGGEGEQKGKDEGSAKAETGEMLSGIKDYVQAADLSAL